MKSDGSPEAIGLLFAFGAVGFIAAAIYFLLESRVKEARRSG